jgi:putative heme-binding domain-containing protein
MDSPNGTIRDMVQQQLVWRDDAAAEHTLARLAADSPRPAARIQALCTLELLGKLRDAQIVASLRDSHAGVRRHALRLAEARFKSSPKLISAALELADDDDAFVAIQLACSLGETDDHRKIAALANVIENHANDPYVTTGVMTSINDDELESLLGTMFVSGPDISPDLASRLFELAGAGANENVVAYAVAQSALYLAHGQQKQLAVEHIAPLEALLNGIRRNSRNTEILTPNAAAQLRSLAEQCMRIADDGKADSAIRLQCFRIVGNTPNVDKSIVTALQGYLSADQDSQLQLAAINALAEQNQPDVADVLLEAWRTFTPAVRNRVLDVLLTREQWVSGLLGAIEQQTVLAAEIDAAYRSRLVEYPNAELRKKANQCFAQSTSERSSVVAKYEEALQRGDAQQGKEVFQKNCAACHKLGEIGSSVGPDIAAREDKSSAGLLREILDPNRAVDQRYAEYVAVTADGRVKNGILVEETSNAIKLRGQQGEETSLLRSQLDSLTSTGKSLMPEGFENQISPTQMADLLQFLAAP